MIHNPPSSADQSRTEVGPLEAQLEASQSDSQPNAPSDVNRAQVQVDEMEIDAQDERNQPQNSQQASQKQSRHNCQDQNHRQQHQQHHYSKLKSTRNDTRQQQQDQLTNFNNLNSSSFISNQIILQHQQQQHLMHQAHSLDMQRAQPAVSADYLAQLIKDNKQLSAFPAVFLHIQRLLDEEISRVRQSLFQLSDVVQMQGPLELPEPEGEVVELQEKVCVPTESHPEYNFVGRILGPRGMTAKQLEQETGCKIKIRGRGSMRDKKKEELYCGKPNWKHLSEDLHVLITVEDTPNRAHLKIRRAIEEVKRLLVPIVDGEDELKKRQLIELAIINGTYRNGLGYGPQNDTQHSNLQQQQQQQQQHLQHQQQQQQPYISTTNNNPSQHMYHAHHQQPQHHQVSHLSPQLLHPHHPASFLPINGSPAINNSGVPSTGSNTPNSVHSGQQQINQMILGPESISQSHHLPSISHHHTHQVTQPHVHPLPHLAQPHSSLPHQQQPNQQQSGSLHHHNQHQHHHQQHQQHQMNQAQAAAAAAAAVAAATATVANQHHHNQNNPHAQLPSHAGLQSPGSSHPNQATLMATQNHHHQHHHHQPQQQQQQQPVQQHQHHNTHQDHEAAAVAAAAANAILYAQQQYHDFQYAALAVQHQSQLAAGANDHHYYASQAATGNTDQVDTSPPNQIDPLLVDQRQSQPVDSSRPGQSLHFGGAGAASARAANSGGACDATEGAGEEELELEQELDEEVAVVVQAENKKHESSSSSQAAPDVAPKSGDARDLSQSQTAISKQKDRSCDDSTASSGPNESAKVGLESVTTTTTKKLAVDRQAGTRIKNNNLSTISSPSAGSGPNSKATGLSITN